MAAYYPTAGLYHDLTKYLGLMLAITLLRYIHSVNMQTDGWQNQRAFSFF